MRGSKKIETLKKFSNNLKKYMYDQDISGAKMARDLGINKSSVSQWMNGINFPSPDTLTKVATYLGVTIDELYGNDSDIEEGLNVENYQVPSYIETYDEAVDFLKSLNLLRAYGGLDVNQKTEEEVLNLARTIHSVLKMQGVIK